jgi:exopolyphosphatase / guanosine-5'-triphosphate,3'-diphosphate pyrophosphatase
MPRMGVLDVGSNTVHLLVVDASAGAHPWPAYSEKTVLRLAERIGPDGALSDDAADALVEAVSAARRAAADHDVRELVAFVTSAVRDAKNVAKVLDRVRRKAGVQLDVLSGEDEARLTFLAVRRWFGWSAGRLLVLDIGGGSLEVAAGVDEEPDIARSLPLGAGRLTRERLRGDPPARADIDALARYADTALAEVRVENWHRAVGTSKALRTLAGLAGAPAASAGPLAPRVLTREGLDGVLAEIRVMPSGRVAELDGVGAGRAHQLVAAAVVARAAMRRLDLPAIDICPWALREGVILRRLDKLPRHRREQRTGQRGR